MQHAHLLMRMVTMIFFLILPFLVCVCDVHTCIQVIGAYVEVRGQPPCGPPLSTSFEASPLALYCVHQASWSGSFRGFSCLHPPSC